MTAEKLLVTGQRLVELKRKLQNASGPLRQMWEHFLILARNNPFWYSNYNVLAYLVTEDDVYAQNVRRHLMNFVDAKDEAFLTQEVQFHTHTSSAPLGRLMIVYDWIADSDVLSADEHARFREAVLDFANLSALQQLQGRARRFDNQIFSNAFAAAITGYVLGIHRDNNPLAHRLYSVGSEWLADQFSRLPHSCYSGEGSTYHQLVVAPLLTLAGAFLDETSQHDVYAQGLPPSNSPLRDWLQADLNMIGPGGIVPGWDAYGVFRTPIKTPLVYLAMREQDPEPLAVILENHMWYHIAHGAWEFDDKLWTLVWWPESVNVETATPYRSWMNSETAGALQNAQADSRFFQYWDECPGAPHCGRPNVNPNAIEFDCNGLPLLLDGAPGIPVNLLDIEMQDLRAYLPNEMLHGLRRYRRMPDSEDSLSRLALSAIAGSVGESNSLVFDHENWYVPLHEVRGTGVALHHAGPLQVIESDSTSYYTDRYDVTKVVRTSAMIDGHTVLCLDEVAAQSPHAVTWQAFTWPDAAANGNTVTAIAGRQVQLDILSPRKQDQWTLTEIQGFPRNPGASTRVELKVEDVHCALRLPVLLAAQPCATTLLDLSTGWHMTADGKAVSENVNLNNFFLTDTTTTGTELQFHKRFTIDQTDRDSELFLRVESGPPELRVTLNGQDVQPDPAGESMSLEGAGTTFALVFECTGKLKAGENELTVTTHHFHGESIRGPVTLMQSKAMTTPRFTAHSTASFEIETAAGSSRLLLASEGIVEWQSGTTDARHALLQPGGKLCLAGVSIAAFPENSLQIESNLPVDVAVSDETVEIGQPATGTEAVIRGENLLIHISASESVHIRYYSARQMVLHFYPMAPLQMIVNGEYLGLRGGPDNRIVAIELKPTGKTDLPECQTAADVYELAGRPTADFADRIGKALDSADWRVQMAAADIAGSFHLHNCTAQLLALLKTETARPTPAWLSHSWRMSKMNVALRAEADHSIDTAADPVEDAKRYRLARAVITSLGKLGAKEAVPTLEQELKKGSLFFLALSQVPVALARLDSTESIPVLEQNREYGEINVHDHVALALDYLHGEIDRVTFEARVNPT